MIYLSPHPPRPSSSPELWGQMITPSRRSDTIGDCLWAMDNEVFTGKFSERRFWGKLARLQQHRKRCLFVVAPDVVSNAIATMSAFRYWGPRIKDAGWPVAFVAQDGQELFPFPPEFDALFIGGSTEWKMGEGALSCIRRAKGMDRWTHVGRVNTQRRIRHFQMAGVGSVDGTAICFGPDKNQQVLDAQLRMIPFLGLFD